MKPLKSNPAPVEAHNVTAAEFISALFPAEAIGVSKPELGQPCVVVSEPWRPEGAAEPLWPPKAYLPRSKQPDELYVNWSTCQAVEHKHSKGRRAGETTIEPRCTNEAFDAQHFLMLDDVGTSSKSLLSPDDERVKNATYLLETSVGNFQVGYKLAEPLNFEQSARLRSALSAAGLGDPGSLKTPHRWCRVPGSVNMKPSKGRWRSALAHWNPERTFTLAQIVEMFKLDLDAAGVSKQLQKAEIPADESDYTDAHFRWMQSLPAGDPGSIIGERRGTGFYPIVCPWSADHDHTRPNPEDGTAYRPGYRNSPPAFRCHHSHGKDATTGTGSHGTSEFLSWCSQQQIATLGTLAGSIAQREEAKRIGAGVGAEPIGTELARAMTLDEMLERFVYLVRTNEVCDLRNPRLAFSPEHFRNLTASSRVEVPDGRSKTKMKPVPVAGAWLASERRQDIEARTWSPGHGQMTLDPAGRKAVNIWTPRAVVEPPSDWQDRAAVFFDHVAYLVPIAEERERFLDWLAHVEQRPGELPHAHYLMIAPGTQGIGRNGMADYLARVWAGNVALSVNLQQQLTGGFNGEMSEKLFAVVDEVREGMKGRFWDAAEAMKSLLNRSHTLINPKFGKQHVEFNCARWTFFSNHLAALPLDDSDRRFWLIENPTKPRDLAYYTRLYGMARDPGVIASVRHAFRTRDINRFNPGERPVMNSIKAQMIQSAKTAEDVLFEELVENPAADVILAPDLQQHVFGEPLGRTDARHRVLAAMLSAAGGVPYDRPVKVDGQSHRVVILRNRERWVKAEPAAVRVELAKWKKPAPRRRGIGDIAPGGTPFDWRSGTA